MPLCGFPAGYWSEVKSAYGEFSDTDFRLSGDVETVSYGIKEITRNLTKLFGRYLRVDLDVPDPQKARRIAVEKFPLIRTRIDSSENGLAFMTGTVGLSLARLDMKKATLTLIGPDECVEKALEIFLDAFPDIIRPESRNAGIKLPELDPGILDYVGNLKSPKIRSVTCKAISRQCLCSGSKPCAPHAMGRPFGRAYHVELLKRTIAGFDPGSVEKAFQVQSEVSLCAGAREQIFHILRDVKIPRESIEATITEKLHTINASPDLLSVGRVATSSEESKWFLKTLKRIEDLSGAKVILIPKFALILGSATEISRATFYFRLFSLIASSLELFEVIRRYPANPISSMLLAAGGLVPGRPLKRFAPGLYFQVASCPHGRVKVPFLKSVEFETRTICMFYGEKEIAIFGGDSELVAKAFDQIYGHVVTVPDEIKDSRSSTSSTLAQISIPLPVRSVILFQAGSMGEDPPAEQLEKLHKFRISPGKSLYSVTVVGSSVVKDTRKEFQEWLEASLVVGLIKLLGFPDIESVISPLISGIQNRPWISSASYSADRYCIEVKGLDPAVRAAVAEVRHWTAARNLKCLAKIESIFK